MSAPPTSSAYHTQPAHRSDLPRSLLKLLADLLCLDPSLRPSCETVLTCIDSIRQSNLNLPGSSKAEHKKRESANRNGLSSVSRMSHPASDRMVMNHLPSMTGTLAVVKRARASISPTLHISESSRERGEETEEINPTTVSSASLDTSTSNTMSLRLRPSRISERSRRDRASRSPSPSATLVMSSKLLPWHLPQLAYETRFRRQLIVGCLVIFKVGWMFYHSQRSGTTVDLASDPELFFLTCHSLRSLYPSLVPLSTRLN